MNKRYQFSVPLEKADASADAAYVAIPLHIKKTFGTNGQVKVVASFDGHPYRGVLAPMGGVHRLGVTQAIRKTIGKKIGDIVKVSIQLDTEERLVDMPYDLTAALEKNKKLFTFFSGLSYTNRKEYARWISTAAKEETRTCRLTLTLEKLKSGKKNPSEK